MFDFFKEKKPEGIENGPLLSVIMPVYNHELYVGEAIEKLHPYGVDVSSGIETDGFKDPVKMRKFVDVVNRCSIRGTVL